MSESTLGRDIELLTSGASKIVECTPAVAWLIKVFIRASPVSVLKACAAPPPQKQQGTNSMPAYKTIAGAINIRTPKREIIIKKRAVPSEPAPRSVGDVL